MQSFLSKKAHRCQAKVETLPNALLPQIIPWTTIIITSGD